MIKEILKRFYLYCQLYIVNWSYEIYGGDKNEKFKIFSV